MAKTDDNAQQQKRPMAPPLKNVQYINTPISVSNRDEDGFREISFVVAPTEQHTYVLHPDAQGEVTKILSGGIEIPTGADIRAATAGGKS